MKAKSFPAFFAFFRQLHQPRFAFSGCFFDTGAGFFGDGFRPAGLGGGAEGLPCLGGTARIKHLGPEPIRSSRWAFRSASYTR